MQEAVTDVFLLCRIIIFRLQPQEDPSCRRQACTCWRYDLVTYPAVVRRFVVHLYTSCTDSLHSVPRYLFNHLRPLPTSLSSSEISVGFAGLWPSFFGVEVYAVHGLCGAWFVQCVVCAVRGLCGAWFVRCVVYAARGLCSAWLVRCVICAVRDLCGARAVRHKRSMVCKCITSFCHCVNLTCYG